MLNNTETEMNKPIEKLSQQWDERFKRMNSLHDDKCRAVLDDPKASDEAKELAREYLRSAS